MESRTGVVGNLAGLDIGVIVVYFVVVIGVAPVSYTHLTLPTNREV